MTELKKRLSLQEYAYVVGTMHTLRRAELVSKGGYTTTYGIVTIRELTRIGCLEYVRSKVAADVAEVL